MQEKTQNEPEEYPPRNHRHPLRQGLEVYNGEDGRLLGYLVDIDPRGMKLVSSCQLPPAQRYQMRIKLPEGHFQVPELYCEAETRWCNPTGFADEYQTGLALASLDADLLHSICKLINLLGYQQRARKQLDQLHNLDCFE